MKNWSLLLLTTVLLVWYVGVSEAGDSNEEGSSKGSLRTAVKSLLSKIKNKGANMIEKVKQYGSEMIEAVLKKAHEFMDKKEKESPAKRAAEEHSNRIFTSVQRG